MGYIYILTIKRYEHPKQEKLEGWVKSEDVNIGTSIPKMVKIGFKKKREERTQCDTLLIQLYLSFLWKERRRYCVLVPFFHKLAIFDPI